MGRKHRRRYRQNKPARVADNAIDARQAQLSTQRVSASLSAFQGPLPPPEILEKYNLIVANGAERIMAMAESQLGHRQSLESVVVNGNALAQRRGQLFAFILGFIGIAGGIGLIAFDKSVSGLVSIITAFVALTSVFIYGRLEQERERERKRREARETTMQPRLPGL